MTNLRSIGGGMVWVAVAGLLMAVTLEPVAVEQKDVAAPMHLATANTEGTTQARA